MPHGSTIHIDMVRPGTYVGLVGLCIFTMIQPTSTIINGRRVEVTEAPWTLAHYLNCTTGSNYTGKPKFQITESFCTATLIDRDWALTARQCVQHPVLAQVCSYYLKVNASEVGKHQVLIRGGSGKINFTGILARKVYSYMPDPVRTLSWGGPPAANETTCRMDDETFITCQDIALLRLKWDDTEYDAARSEGRLQSIPLAYQTDKLHNQCQNYGFGWQRFAKVDGYLYGTNTTIVAEGCQMQVFNKTWEFCAKDLLNNGSGCAGDGGSPFVCRDKQNTQKLTGVENGGDVSCKGGNKKGEWFADTRYVLFHEHFLARRVPDVFISRADKLKRRPVHNDSGKYYEKRASGYVKLNCPTGRYYSMRTCNCVNEERMALDDVLTNGNGGHRRSGDCVTNTTLHEMCSRCAKQTESMIMYDGCCHGQMYRYHRICRSYFTDRNRVYINN